MGAAKATAMKAQRRTAYSIVLMDERRAKFVQMRNFDV
jgi:hypothetical protein